MATLVSEEIVKDTFETPWFYGLELEIVLPRATPMSNQPACYWIPDEGEDYLPVPYVVAYYRFGGVTITPDSVYVYNYKFQGVKLK